MRKTDRETKTRKITITTPSSVLSGGKDKGWMISAHRLVLLLWLQRKEQFMVEVKMSMYRRATLQFSSIVVAVLWWGSIVWCITQNKMNNKGSPSLYKKYTGSNNSSHLDIYSSLWCSCKIQNLTALWHVSTYVNNVILPT